MMSAGGAVRAAGASGAGPAPHWAGDPPRPTPLYDWRRWWSVALVGFALIAVATCETSAQSTKPRVPPGRDPGGVAIAYIGPGLDYTWAEIAPRLARDGEGEIIGWDFLDNDRRPYDRCDYHDGLWHGDCATLRGWQIVKEPGAARLVVVRASADKPQTLVQAFGLVAQSPARIVLLSPTAPSQPAALDPVFLREASQRLPALLFVVGTTPGIGLAASAPRPDNVIVVAATDGAVTDGGADLGVQVGHLTAQRNEIAAARVAALAARLLRVEPQLDAVGLKRRILALAEPAPPAMRVSTRHGWIAEPERHFLPR